MDTLAMATGFLVAKRIPWWAVIVIALAFEAFVIFMIRDGLLLNIINLIFPFEFIATWQSGG